MCQQVIIHHKLNPEDKIKFPTAIDLHKWLVASVKSQCQWYYEVSKCAPQYALRYLSDAFKSFFKKNKGFPKFKKKGKHDSFTLDGAIHIEQKKVKVPVIGWLKTYEVLPFGYQPKSVTISKQADKWFVSWKIEVETSQNPKKQPCVGVDLGINHLAILSTGEVFDGLKSYKKYESKLARMQYLNRHKKVGSNNYRKAQIKIARLHQKIANMRKDTLHKITTYISKNHAAINLKQEAVRLTVLACGLDSADTSRMKQEEKADFC